MSRMGGMQRNSSIPSKERKLKGILNNLTPENIKEISEQVIAVNIDNLFTLAFLVSQIFEKALKESTLCEMYANLCFHLQAELPYFIQDNEKITFKRFLVNMCQEQFERGEREQDQEEANKTDEGERRCVLGNIRLIGELYKKKILTERVIHECIRKLLGEEDVEALCELMIITGEIIDRPIAKKLMDVYFERMRLLSNEMDLSSRLRFMLKELIDLRNNKWQKRYDAQRDFLLKQRKLQGILNKLTPQNFEKLSEQVKEVDIDDGVTLSGLVSQIFEKALIEPTMYANFCFHLAAALPDLSQDNEKKMEDAEQTKQRQLKAESCTKDRRKLEVSDKTQQALHDTLRRVSSVPSLPAPKQHLANKDTCVAEEYKAGDTHIGTRTKKDTLVSALPQASQMQKSSVISLNGISTAFLQMPLPIESASQVQNQVFVRSLQPRPIHPQKTTSKHCMDSSENAGSGSVSFPPAASTKHKPKVEVPRKTKSEVTAKKYSQDFLLKFAKQCTDLPEGFEITADIADALMCSNTSSHTIDRDSHPSTGRITDRSGGMSRMNRCTAGVIEENKWSKVSNAFHSCRHLNGVKGNTEFQPGQRGKAGGILSRPMQSQKKGLIPSHSSQSPLQIIHKAEKKYEVGKMEDAEQTKQRQLQGILNKLSPQNFEKLFEQVKAVNIDNAVTLTGFISQIFEKALIEPTFCEMYANFCFHLAAALPDLSQDNEEITFKRLLLNKCQEEFEKETNVKRRRLGNIRLIGELYKKMMLTDRIMHECIIKLLVQNDEEDVEALCELMSTIGEKIDQPKNKRQMDLYFQWMKSLSNYMKLSSKVRFMLKGVIDLRNNKWQQRLAEVPKICDAQSDAIASAVSVKMCSGDFLLKLAEQSTDLPELCEIAAVIAKELMGVSASQSLLYKAENKHEIGKVGDEKKATQRPSKAVSDVRLDELFSRLDNFQCFVRERLDHIDNSIESLDYQMRRLQYYHHNGK